jgi:hypothetical protein
MTEGRLPLAMVVALLATAVSAGCHNDKVTLAVGRDAGGGATGADAANADAVDAGTADAADAHDADAGPEMSDAQPGVWVQRTPCVIPAGVPVAREQPLVAFDQDRHKMIVFGGEGSYGAMTDLWELDPATSAWTERTGCNETGFTPTATGHLVVDRARNRLLLFSGTDGVVSEWDPNSGAWTKRQPAPGGAFPTGPILGAISDDTRGKAMVFTVVTRALSPPLVEVFTQLWEWDGSSGAWQMRADGLPWRSFVDFPALAFDADRDVLWMFGGGPVDRLWRLDAASATLTDLTPAVRPADWPPARDGAEMAYDRVRGRVVLFGGQVDEPLRDLWELDPTTVTWHNRTPANVAIVGDTTPAGVTWPVAALGTGIFADADSGQILRFATFGSFEQPALWKWDGGAGVWSTHSFPALAWPHGSPLSTFSAWDSSRGKLLLYDSGNRDLWQWGTAVGRWDRLTPAGISAFSDQPDPVPWPRGQRPGVAWDAGTRRLVIFGGLDNNNNNALGDLWIVDPATGQATNPPRPSTGWPLPRFNQAMAYDPVRQRVLMFGGSLPEASDELWSLDSAHVSWERIAPAGDWPPARAGHVLVLDEQRGVLVLQGGAGSDATATLSDTWELPAGSSTWQQRSPSAPQVRFLGYFTHHASFVRGLGVVALGVQNNDAGLSFALWKWDSVAAAWVAAGVDPPLPTAINGVSGEAAAVMAGGGDLLFMLIPGVPSRPVHEQDFFETWEWRAP